MSRFYTVFGVLLLVSSFSAQINRPIGINLGGITDYSPEFEFVDVFKQSREWIAHEIPGGSPWSSGVNIPLNANGFPLEIPYNDGIHPPQAIRTLLYFGQLNNIFPSGNYRLMVAGTGQIQLFGGASGTYNCPIDTLVAVNSANGGIIFDILESQASDPLHDIHFVMPGHHTTFASEPFHPSLLSFVEDFQVIRFMDWQRTNGSKTVNWNDRSTPNYFTQTLENGVAPEILIDLCNRTQKHPWICLPHKASDDYIVQYATLLKNTLDTNLTIHLEYSNEVWNGQFEQNAYCDSMGNTLGYPGAPWDRTWQYYAKRTADIFHLFDSVFAGTDRLYKIVAGQAVNPWLTNQILTYFESPVYNPHQVDADAFAIAPYFGGVADAIGNAGLAASCTVDQILDSMEAQMPESLQWMQETKTVTDNYQLDLVCYEGGQHLVAGYLYHNDVAFVDKLSEANRHPRMQDMYCDYFNFWYDSVVPNLFCHFSSHYISGKYGSWGVKEFYEDSLSPKYLGLKECVFSYNTPTADVHDNFNESFKIVVYPNPTENGQFSIKHHFLNPKIELYDPLGRKLEFNYELHSNVITVTTENYEGYIFISISENQINYVVPVFSH